MIALALVPDGRSVLEERFKGAAGRWADVAIYESDRTLTLRIDVRNGSRPGSAWHYSRTLHVEIALAHPASCTVNGRWCTGNGGHPGWDLNRNDTHDDGPFKDAFDWVRNELWDADVVEMDASWSDRVLDRPFDAGYMVERAGIPVVANTWREHPDCKHVYKRMGQLCDLASERAIELCEPAAREAAVQLKCDARFFAYSALLADPSGRVRQMIDVCPGLFTLGALGNPYDATASGLIAGIRAGHTLAKLIELVLPAAADAFCAAGSTVALSRTSAAFLRRLPAMPLDDLLHVLHAPGLDINDLHHAGESAGLWLQTMADWGRRARRIANRHRATTIGGFLSKHAVAIQDRDPHFMLDEMMDWLEGAGAPPPGRETLPTTVRRAIDQWHEHLYLRVCHALETPLARGPAATREVVGIHVVAIETVGQLVTEGNEMRHCVAAFADDAVSGDVFFFRGTVAGGRVTISIAGASGHWWLREASGYANQRLEADEIAVIHRWLEALP